MDSRREIRNSSSNEIEDAEAVLASSIGWVLLVSGVPSPQLNLVEKDRNIGQNRDMDRRQVISKLREHRDELTAAGIVHLRVFGSVARGEANDSSDVDLIAEFDNKKKWTLLDMVGLENHLSELLQVKVDLTPAETMKQRVRATAYKEAVLAF